jgi:O-antigen biosynthesis protein WbqV
LDQLLQRPTVALDPLPLRRIFSGRRVLVTGAGGSIGSELSRQLADLGCDELQLLDYSELNLLEIYDALRGRAKVRDVFCDIRDRRRVDQWLGELKPDYVFHAAALKHVHLVERHPVEGVMTNVVGASNVAEAARRNGAKGFTFISSDKAVAPVSVMGATKRLGEAYVATLEMERRAGIGGMESVAVRFGNVLRSTGSVVPLFERQIAAGGPLTITHPDVERYFMTVEEAVALTLHAGVHAARAPAHRHTPVFLLEMGEPIRILDLAHRMIRAAGKRPNIDIEIKTTGLREGEKITEGLVDQDEVVTPAGVTGLFEVRPKRSQGAFGAREALALEQACRALTPEMVRMRVFDALDRVAPRGAADAV